MATGGKRPGSGRKPGSKNKSTQVIEALAADAIIKGKEGLTPLEIMLDTMRLIYERALAHDSETIVNEKRLTPLDLALLAVDVAAKAAPYVHPRLTTVDMGKKTTENAAELLSELLGKAPN
jgi:hypothetical protein